MLGGRVGIERVCAWGWGGTHLEGGLVQWEGVTKAPIEAVQRGEKGGGGGLGEGRRRGE